MEDCRICNDILNEIFLRIPSKSVFRFKCLSKYWNDRLSDNAFRKRYKSMPLLSSSPSLSPLSGFFFGFTQISFAFFKPVEPSMIFSFAPTCKQGMHMLSGDCFRKLGSFFGDSNGLILCGVLPLKYYVCNPLTDQYVQLPQPHNSTFNPKKWAIGFLYEEEEHGTDPPTYTIIRADHDGLYTRYLPTETYCSNSAVWTESKLWALTRFNLIAGLSCRVLGGIFYWYGVGIQIRFPYGAPTMLIARDPKAKHNRMWQINLPTTIYYPVIGETTDGLLLFPRYTCLLSFKIWSLREKLHRYNPYLGVPSSEWISFFNVNNGPEPPISGATNFSMISFHPQESTLVLMRFNTNIGGPTLFWYNYTTKESASIRCLDVPSLKKAESRTIVPYYQVEWPPSPQL